MPAVARTLLATVLAAGLVLPTAARTTFAASPSPSPEATPTGEELMSVTPSLIVANVNAGGRTSIDVTFRAAADLAVSIEPNGLGQDERGDFVFIDASADTGPLTARTFLSVAPTAFPITAGSSAVFRVDFTVPAGTPDAIRYAVLRVDGKRAASGSNVGVNAALGIPVILTIGKPTQTRTGALGDLTAATKSLGGPLDVGALLTNTGSMTFGLAPFGVRTVAVLQDPKGTIVATGRGEMSGPSVIPTYQRALGLTLQPDPPIGDGRYHLELEASLEDGTVLDRAAIDLVAVKGGILGTDGGPQAPPPTEPWVLVAVALLVGAIAGGLVVGVTGWRDRRRMGTAASSRPGDTQDTPDQEGRS